MKRFVIGCVLALISAFFGGCVHRPDSAARNSAHRLNAFALAVTVNGGLQPTPLQWAAIREKCVREFSRRGWVLVTDLALADYIVRVDFTPNPTDPENSGHAVVLGVRDNPRKLLASLTTLSPYPTSFGYTGSFRTALWQPSFSTHYYGWSEAYYDGYSYDSPTLNPVRPPTVVTTPPTRPYHRHHYQPDNPDYCPPDQVTQPTQPRHNRLPRDFAAASASTSPDASADSSSGRRWHGGDWRGGTSSGSFARSDNGSSNANSSSSGRWWRGESSSTRGDSSGWRSERASRSDSSPSYSRSDSGGWHSRSDSGGSWQSPPEPSYASSSSSSDSPSFSSSSSSDSSFSSASSSSNSDGGATATPSSSGHTPER